MAESPRIFENLATGLSRPQARSWCNKPEIHGVSMQRSGGQRVRRTGPAKIFEYSVLMVMDSPATDTPGGGAYLRVQRVCKRYGSLAALDDVSLEIARGAFMTLLGPSGSGKTTLLMAIAGFVEPDAGDILLEGRSVLARPPERRDFGMVFQGYALFPHQTVTENIAFPLRARRVSAAERRARIERVLDLVQLSGLGDRLPRQLSGGQQQRVALARALVYEPKLLLLDEPLSALDRKLRVELQSELKALHARLEMTFVYVTHDQDEALSLSDRIAVMRAGRIEQLGAPQELYRRPRTAFVAGFLGKSNMIAAQVIGRNGAGLTLSRAGVTLVAGAAEAPIGAEVTLAVRPEHVAVSTAEPTALPNRTRAIVRARSFFGASLHLDLESSALGPLTAEASGWSDDTALRPGAEVWVGWSAEAPVLVER
jgi:putative spermidine/putrescine transport system ATP-binding protein